MARTKQPTQRTPESMQRREQIVQMRRARLSFAEIGRRLGISGQRAGQLYRQALREIPAQAVHEHRQEEVELIDTAMNRLMAIAADQSVTPRTRVEAWSAVRGWADRKAKLLGLDAPAQHEVDMNAVVEHKPTEVLSLIERARRQVEEDEARLREGQV